MDQFQAVSAVPQYIDNPFLTAAGTSLPTAQSIVQWPPTAYRHTAPTIDVSAVPRQQRPRLNASLSLSLSLLQTSIPPPQIPILPQSSTSSSSSQIISQSSSPTQSRTASPVRGVASSGSNSKLAAKRTSRRPSADQTTPPPQQQSQGVEAMANKTYEEVSGGVA